jgi:hypothetical protein
VTLQVRGAGGTWQSVTTVRVNGTATLSVAWPVGAGTYRVTIAAADAAGESAPVTSTPITIH